MTPPSATLTRDPKEKLRRLARGARGGLVSTETAAELLGLPRSAAALTLQRLGERGWLSRVRRGLYLILPLEAGLEGGAVEDPWVLASELFGPCYVGGWTAAEHWGLTDQLFRSTFVVSAASVRRTTSAFLGSEFHVVRSSHERVSSVPTIWHGKERVAVSDRERTIADALAAPDWVGGVRHLAEILRAYRTSKDWDPARLVTRVAEEGSGAAFKRLGFLSERVLGNEKVLVEEAFARRTTGNVRLDPSVPTNGRLSTHWHLWVNVTLPDEGPIT
jgi:predicted transcriptional regulator of viral defense system